MGNKKFKVVINLIKIVDILFIMLLIVNVIYDIIDDVLVVVWLLLSVGYTFQISWDTSDLVFKQGIYNIEYVKPFNRKEWESKGEKYVSSKENR